MDKNLLIEKANHQVGDMHPNGKLVWTEYKPGKFDWRGVKKSKSGEGAAASTNAAPSPSSASNKQQTASTASAATNSASAPKANKTPYDAPKATVTYKQAPDPKVNYRVPESWQAMGKNGKLVKFDRSAYRKLYADKTKMPDDKLIKILNGENNNENIRMLAYEEAAARGIPENKISVKGSLKRSWDKKKAKYDMLHSDNSSDDNEDEFTTYDMTALKGMDVDAFMEQFPNGDSGWTEKDDKRVQKEFNNFQSLTDRQRYDAFLDFQKRRDPMYASPMMQLQGLNRQFFHFMNGSNSPMMVSAGGAGAGKTTGMLKVADAAGLTRFDPDKHQPGDGDYDFFIADKDIDDEKEFRKMLAEHNGKIIVFDDKDKLLTSTASSTVSLMKSLADGNPSMRIFKNPADNQQTKFTGKLLFITNKTMDKLQKDEDHKAIMSRAVKNDVHFTINENIEVLKNRYKTMGDKMKSVDLKKEEQIRQDVFDIISDNVDKIDPDKFTVRKFTEALEYVDTIEETNEQAEDNDNAAELFGDVIDWKRNIVSILNKAEETDIEKALPPYSNTKKIDISDMSEDEKKKMVDSYKKDPKTFKELFGEEILKLLGIKGEKKKEVDKVEKAMDVFFGDMTLEEAEDVLFG